MSRLHKQGDHLESPYRKDMRSILYGSPLGLRSGSF